MVLTGCKRLIGCLKSQNDWYMTHIWIIPPSCHTRMVRASHHPYHSRTSRRMIGMWHIHESSLHHVYTNGSCLSSPISLTNKSFFFFQYHLWQTILKLDLFVSDMGDERHEPFNIINVTDCTANADVAISCDRCFNMIIQNHSRHSRTNVPIPCSNITF